MSYQTVQPKWQERRGPRPAISFVTWYEVALSCGHRFEIDVEALRYGNDKDAVIVPGASCRCPWCGTKQQVTARTPNRQGA